MRTLGRNKRILYVGGGMLKFLQKLNYKLCGTLPVDPLTGHVVFPNNRWKDAPTGVSVGVLPNQDNIFYKHYRIVSGAGGRLKIQMLVAEENHMQDCISLVWRTNTEETRNIVGKSLERAKEYTKFLYKDVCNVHTMEYLNTGKSPTKVVFSTGG